MTEPITFSGRSAAVLGLGRSGVAAAEALLDLGAAVVVVDESDDARYAAAAERLRAAGADVRRATSEIPAGVDMVVTSPGLRHGHPLVLAAAAAGAEVISEPELAWRLRPNGSAPWLGITGTNGKTTTTGMLEAILRAAGLRTVAAGNVGLPLTEAVRTAPSYDVLAVEVSSAQLAQSQDIRFEVGAILNLAPDHIDWHGDFAAYRQAKLRIWRDAVVVGNADDLEVAAVMPVGATTFSLDPTSTGWRLAAGSLTAPDGQPFLAAKQLSARGPHNIANALAAAAVADAYGVDLAAVAAGLAGFTVGSHRSDVVAEGGGVAWIDDSKATNPHAAAASLAAHESIVWIAGGLLKGAEVDELVATHAGRLRAAVLIGVDRSALAGALARHAPEIPVVEVAATDTGAMSVAVAAAAELAHPGDVVLLAPSAASWDIFRDYAQRGDLFAEAARAVVAAE